MIHKFRDLQDFIENSNNFWLYFSEGMIVYEQNPTLLKFKKIHPKKYLILRFKVKEARDKFKSGLISDTNEALPWSELFLAYQIFGSLTDGTEDFIIRNGQIDALYYTR